MLEPVLQIFCQRESRRVTALWILLEALQANRGKLAVYLRIQQARFARLGLAALATCLLVTAAPAAEFNLKASHSAAPSEPYQIGLQAFADRVKERSGGTFSRMPGEIRFGFAPTVFRFASHSSGQYSAEP